MSVLSAVQTICREVLRKRQPGQGGGGGGGASTPPQAAAPTEFVDGRWQVIGAERSNLVAAALTPARRMAQVAAPLATGAAVTGATLLVCHAVGLPDALIEAGRRLLAGDDGAGTGASMGAGGAEETASPVALPLLDGPRLLASGPSVFPPDAVVLNEEAGVPVPQQSVGTEVPAPVPVPEPTSIAVFGVSITLLACLLLASAVRRRRTRRSRAAA